MNFLAFLFRCMSHLGKTKANLANALDSVSSQSSGQSSVLASPPPKAQGHKLLKKGLRKKSRRDQCASKQTISSGSSDFEI